MGYLFDTNAAIALHKLDTSLDKVIQQAEKDKENIFFSVITQSEFIAGLSTDTDLNSIPFLGGNLLKLIQRSQLKRGASDENKKISLQEGLRLQML